MAVAAIVSFRLGGTDGVSVAAERWARALRACGFTVVTVAGEGPVDRCVEGLAIEAPEPPSLPRGGGGAPRTPGSAAPPRPGLAAGAVRACPGAATGRSRLAPRHDQPDDRARVRPAGPAGHDDLQRLRRRRAHRRSSAGTSGTRHR